MVLLSRIGESIQKARKKTGISQEWLAENIDRTTRHIQKIEAGDVNPSATVLARIREALGVSWDELMSGV